MKRILPLLSLLVVLGVLYGLAFVGVLPAQKWADKTPALAPALRALHLAKAKKPTLVAPLATAPPDPAQKALAAGQKQLAQDRAQLTKEEAAFASQKQQAASAPPAPTAPIPDTAGKLNAIYATMSPDDLARLFAKLPDPVVIQSLTALDEKKAGQVLAALPDARAARLSQRMLTPSAAVRTATAAPAPQVSLP